MIVQNVSHDGQTSRHAAGNIARLARSWNV